MADLPRGTVTFLFTDIEGSTRLLRELGADGYREALADHRRVLRDAFARHGGVEVDTQGDAFFVAFERASGAVAAAAEAQAGLYGGPIVVRMGIHTGEPTMTEDGYIGLDVHRAARIAAAAHGGQVLLSQSARDLVDVELRDLGDHRLKDLSAPERLWQLGERDFPRLKTLYQTNLPVPATVFLGREREVADVAQLLARDKVRLVTLTGPGGTGKTRLALQAAGAAADGYPDGVWWVPLAPLRDAALVSTTAAAALGATHGLEEHIGARRMLLLLDNFEHVLDAAPEVASLLARCPHLDLLVTSRESLRLDGEWEYSVDPLREEEAVELFQQRARAAQRDFTTNGEVREICARLDHLPLAIELAAARVKFLSPPMLLERLEQRLPVLTGGARDAPERQRTLRATLEWSHDLLSNDERRVFRRLAVFAGGCTLEAAETVCEADLDLLSSLVDKSLVRRSGDRFWMLETIRDYALGRLEEFGEGDARERHGRYFGELIEKELANAERGQVFESGRLRPELDNVRAAHRDAIERGDHALRLQTAIGVGMCLWEKGGYSEVRAAIESALSQAADASPRTRARALNALASTAFGQGDTRAISRFAEEALRLHREENNEVGVALSLLQCGIAALRESDLERARVLHRESAELLRKLGHPSVFAALQNLGSIALLEGDTVGATALFEEARLADERAGLPENPLLFLNLGLAAILDGRAREAHALYRRGLERAQTMGADELACYGLEGIAAARIGDGRPPFDAVRLLGAAAVARTVMDAPVDPLEAVVWERTRATARALLGEEQFDAAMSDGGALGLWDAVAEALALD